MNDLSFKDYCLIMGILIEKSINLDNKIKEGEYCCKQELISLKRELNGVNQAADKVSQIINKKGEKK